MPIAFGFDVGTQGTKALAVCLESKRVLARARVSYGLIPGLSPGHAEQDPETWVEALRKTSGQLLAASAVSRDEVVALGVSGQQHGAVLLGDDQRPLRPAKLWCDTSAVAEADELTRLFDRAVPVGFTAPKLRWSQRHEPELWRKVRRVLLPHDYLNFRLTGSFSMEAGDASGTGLFNVRNRSWCQADIDALDPGLSDMLPAISSTGRPAGRLHAQGAALLGLKEGVLVGAGGGDNMMSAIGAGATRPGVVVASLGTSGTIFTRSDVPIIDPEGLIAPFCDSAGAWLPLLCVMNCTGPLEEIAGAFGLSHEELSSRAALHPPGSGGLRWLPFLRGERVPDLPEARGTLLGMEPGWLDPGRLYRAGLEGVSLNLAAGLERMRALGIGVDQVRLVGGASRNALWREILAAAFGVPIVGLEEPETGALGAALQATWILQSEEGRDTSIDDVAAPFVHLEGDATLPSDSLVARYRELAKSFASDLSGR